MDGIIIEFESEKLQRALSTVQQRIGDLSPLMADIGELLTQSTKQRFATSTAPDGTPWAPLKDGSGRKPLVLTGTTRDQIFPDSGSDFVEIVASTKQSPVHQFGADPFQIETKNFGFVEHPGVPARPFLGVSAADEAEIIKLAAAYIDVFGG
jgi:phage virion morphogenesis protein